MRCLSARVSLFLLALVLVSVSACTRTEVTRYERVSDSRVDEAYISPDADFSRYRSLYPQPLEIYYAEGQTPPAPESLERMRSIFREEFLAVIGDDYAIVRSPAADALEVRFSLVDMKINPAIPDQQVQGKLQHLIADGQLSLFLELRDSMSGEILGRAADEERVDGVNAMGDDIVAWEQVRGAARRWAAMFRDFLDQNLS